MESVLGALPAVAGDGPAAVARHAPVLTFDIGGTKIAAGVVDDEGHAHSFLVAPTDPHGDAQRSLERLWDLGRRAVTSSDVSWSDIGAIGIACGGPLDVERGVLLRPPYLPGWHDVPIAALAEEALGRPAALENDAAAAAAGEHRYGAGAGTRHMIYFTVSTGVGGGVIVDGRLYRGAMGNGGELGHVTVDWNGRPCRGCGRLGCLEAYASGTAIAERAQEALAVSDGSSSLASAPAPTAGDVAAAAREGDPLATAIWDETVAALSCGVTSIVNVFEPELVVIGGGVSRAGEQLIAPVREWVHAHAMTPGGENVPVVRASLGDQVGVVGAAAVAYERIESGVLQAHG